MTVTVNVTAVSLGSSSAPVIEGSTPSSFGSAGGGVGFSNTSATGRIGCRIALSSATDFTTHDFIAFQFYGTDPFGLSGVDTVANGGRRIIFVDNVGSYAGFNVYGSGIPNYSDSVTGASNGFWGTFNSIAGSSSTANHVARTRTPDISSGTIDWTNITHIEISLKLTSSQASNLYVGNLCKHNGVTITGTETLSSVVTGVSATYDPKYIQRGPYTLESAGSVGYSYKTKFNVGNGSTLTNWTDSNFSINLFTTYDKSPTFRSVGPLVLLDNSNTRAITINQSASDTLNISDFSIGSAAYWQWSLSGSGSALCERGLFSGFNGFTAGHGTYNDVIWDSGEAAVSVSSSTVITRGTIRNGVGHGLKITGAAGDYSDLDIDFLDNSTYDIEVGSGGAGTYTLSSIGVIGSYTLKIRNDSATNAVTVEIPGGITYSSSTAGGTLTVSTPSVYQEVTVNGLPTTARLQIYDVTSSTELYNGVPGATSYTWTDTNPASASRAIRIRIARVNGATDADLFLEKNIGTCGTNSTNNSVSYLHEAVADTVYESNAINGSTVTGITFTDSTVDKVNIDVASNSVSWPQIYAAWAYYSFGSTGIATDIDYINAVDPANYILSNMLIKNTSSPSEPLEVTGGYGRDAITGASIDLVDTTGGTLVFAPDHVVSYAVGSGVTSQDKTDIASAVLSAASSAPIAANIKKVADTTVTGSGTSGDPWGP